MFALCSLPSPTSRVYAKGNICTLKFKSLVGYAKVSQNTLADEPTVRCARPFCFSLSFILTAGSMHKNAFGFAHIFPTTTCLSVLQTTGRCNATCSRIAAAGSVTHKQVGGRLVSKMSNIWNEAFVSVANAVKAWDLRHTFFLH